jgi:hypothetical protein
MTNAVTILSEPELEFRYGQRLLQPQDGLGLFGPYDTDASSHPGTINYAVFGSAHGIKLFQRWSAIFDVPIVNPIDVNDNLWPSFPGFEAITASKWPSTPSWTYEIDGSLLTSTSRQRDSYKRAYQLVSYFLEGFRVAQKRDESFRVFICIIPDEVWQNCRPESVVIHGVGRKLSFMDRRLRMRGQRELFEDFEPETYHYSVDFRRQLKARAMEFGIPIQILLESTLSLDPLGPFSRRLTPISDRAWNLATTIYYKAGGKPWRLSTARKGVCYIGIAFRKQDSDLLNTTACCAAQMFLDSGDGVVFLGEYGPWFSPRHGDFHLSREAARTLLTGVLRTYDEMFGEPLTEIFLHSRSSINDDEFAGYAEACPSGVKLVGIRVRLEKTGLKLYRPGTRPVIRGTFLNLSASSGYLWASGFKPRLRTYDGWEVPVPLRLDVQHGEANIEEVASDIFGLTKLNYNTSHLGDSEPVTILFSNAVGEILISNPLTEKRLPSFKFYI